MSTTPRTISTEEELAELLANDDRSVILTDSGGFVWWSEYTSEAGNILVGCAQPMCGGALLGMAVQFWGNAMHPHQAIAYGPFTLIKDSHDGQQP